MYDLGSGISGAIAGISSWMITYPVDTIKSRLQLQKNLSFKAALYQGNLFKGLKIT